MFTVKLLLVTQTENPRAWAAAGSSWVEHRQASQAVGAMFVGPALVWLSWNSWAQKWREKCEKDPNKNQEKTAGWWWPGFVTSKDASAEFQARSPGNIWGPKAWDPELQVRSRDLSLDEGSTFFSEVCLP